MGTSTSRLPSSQTESIETTELDSVYDEAVDNIFETRSPRCSTPTKTASEEQRSPVRVNSCPSACSTPRRKARRSSLIEGSGQQQPVKYPSVSFQLFGRKFSRPELTRTKSGRAGKGATKASATNILGTTRSSYCRSFGTYDVIIFTADDGRKVVAVEFSDKAYINGQPVHYYGDGRVVNKDGAFDPMLQYYYDCAMNFKMKGGNFELQQRNRSTPTHYDTLPLASGPTGVQDVNEEAIEAKDLEKVFEELSKRIGDLVAENERLQSKISEVEIMNTNLQIEVSNSSVVSDREIKQTECAIAEVSAKLAQAEEYNKKLETLFYDVEESRVKAQVRAEHLEVERGGLAQVLKETNQENAKLKKSLESLELSLKSALEGDCSLLCEDSPGVEEVERRESERLRKKAERLRDLLREKTGQLKNCSRELSTLERKVGELQTVNAHLSAMFSTYESRIKGLENQQPPVGTERLERIECENEGMKVEISRMETLLVDLRTKLRGAEEDKAELTDKLEKNSRDVDLMKGDLVRLKEQNEKLQAAYNRVNMELITKTTSLMTVRREKSKIQDEKERLEVMFAATHSKLEKNLEERKEMEALIRKLDDQNRDQRVLISDASEETLRLRNDIEARDDFAKQLAEKIHTLKMENESLKGRKVELEIRCSMLASETDAFRRRHVQMKEALDSLVSQDCRQQARMKELQIALDSISSELQAVESAHHEKLRQLREDNVISQSIIGHNCSQLLPHLIPELYSTEDRESVPGSDVAPYIPERDRQGSYESLGGTVESESGHSAVNEDGLISVLPGGNMNNTEY